MTTLAVTSPPAPRARSAALFFVLALGATALLGAPSALVRGAALPASPERFAPLYLLASFAPTIVAFVLAGLERGGVRGLVRPLGLWRVGAVWYVIALALPGAVLVAGMLAWRLVAGEDAPLFYPPTDGQHIAAMVTVPLADQLAWRGFAFARLERRAGPLRASLVVGTVWALYHLEKHALFGLVPMPQGAPLSLAALMIAGTVVFTWIQRRARGSLLLAVLAHAGVYLDNSAAALPATVTPLVVHTIGFVGVALGVVFGDRTAWREDACRGRSLATDAGA